MRKLALATVILLAACANERSDQSADGSGSRDFAAEPFTGIAVSGPYDVVVTQGSTRAVRAEGSPNGIEQLRIRVVDGQLRISPRRGITTPTGKVIIYVTAPTIDRASIGGSGNISIDKAGGASFTGSIGGSGDLSIGSLRADRAEFAVAGSGNVVAAGTAGDAHYSIAGSGSIDGKSLATRTASVSIAGSGSTSANVTEAATISIMGSGDVDIKGGATCKVSKMGSGEVTCAA